MLYYNADPGLQLGGRGWVDKIDQTLINLLFIFLSFFFFTIQFQTTTRTRLRLMLQLNMFVKNSILTFVSVFSNNRIEINDRGRSPLATDTRLTSSVYYSVSFYLSISDSDKYENMSSPIADFYVKRLISIVYYERSS